MPLNATSPDPFPNMRQLWELMSIGYTVADLATISKYARILPDRETKPGLVERLRQLESDLEKLDLKQGMAWTGHEVAELREQLEARQRHGLRVGRRCSRRLHRLARHIQRNLQQEAGARTVFVAERNREGEIEGFLSQSALYLGFDGTQPLALPSESQVDFEIAARCYAVNFNAASMMFLLRGMEAIVKNYFYEVTKLDPKKDKKDNRRREWGHCNETLRIPVLNCPKEVSDDSLALSKVRNSLMHPNEELPFDLDDATTTKTLKQCQTFLRKVFDDLKARKAPPGLSPDPS